MHDMTITTEIYDTCHVCGATEDVLGMITEPRISPKPYLSPFDIAIVICPDCARKLVQTIDEKLVEWRSHHT